MARARRSWPVIAILMTLVVLVAVARLAAQKRTTEKSDAYGGGTVITKDYNEDGTVSREEYADAKGKLRQVNTYSYDPDTHKLTQKTEDKYRDDGTLSGDYITGYDENGKPIKYWTRCYDSQGEQTYGYMEDVPNHKGYFWDRETDSYTESKYGPPYGEKRPEELPPGKKPGDISYQPLDLGMIVPSYLPPGTSFSGSIMPAADAQNFASVPGVTVKTFTATLPGGQFSPVGYQGLTVGTPDNGYEPVVDGHFTVTIPPATVSLTLVNQQQRDTQSKPTVSNISLATPSWAASSNIYRPAMTKEEHDFALAYLNYLWFKVTDYEEEWDDAYDDGAPNWVLAEIDDDIDWDQAIADRIAQSLPIDEVRAMAHYKALYEAWLDQHYHYGTSIVHKDNIDYYAYRAVPQDYLARRILYALIAPPILQSGRLGVLRGNFSGDGNDMRVNVDGHPVRFIASGLNDYYFMPPDNMTPGQHKLSVWNGPFLYSYPVFSMALGMSVDMANLHTRSFPKSTTWHLVLAGLNGMPASNWVGGGYSPDLTSLADLGNLPKGFEFPGQTREGVIVLKVSNLSQGVISIPDLPGGQRTWVLDAQRFAPRGEFHFDSRLDALRDGEFVVDGLAVSTLKPVFGLPERPGPPGGGPPETIPSFSGTQDSSKDWTAQLQQGGNAYTEAQKSTEGKRKMMNKSWDDACLKAPMQLRLAYESAGKNYVAAEKAWNGALLDYSKNPSDEYRLKLAPLISYRFEKRAAFQTAREAVIERADAPSLNSWRTAKMEYEKSAYHEALTKETLEGFYKAAGSPK